MKEQKTWVEEQKKGVEEQKKAMEKKKGMEELPRVFWCRCRAWMSL